MSDSCITNSINANCSCGTCSTCKGLKISELPQKTRVSSNTQLVGADSYLYTVKQIEQYLLLKQGDVLGNTFNTDADTQTLLPVLGGNNIFACTDTGAPRTLEFSTATISQGSPTSPILFEVKDQSGGAGTNNITVSTEGLATIDGAATIQITINYGILRLYSDGSNLFTR